MKNKTLLYLLLVFIVSCTKSNQKDDNKNDLKSNLTEIHYAKGFTIQRLKNYTIIEVRNPWDVSRMLEKYILIDRDKATPPNLPQGTIVKIPVQRVATCSSIFAGEYEKLNSIDKIIAVSEPQYVDIPEIKAGLQNGKITDLGITVKLNTEKLLASKPDILIISPFEESMHDRFKKLGIVVVKDASYMEETPLGRAEWIKFEAAFLKKDAEAAKIYQEIELRYTKLKQMADACKKRPTVFTEKKFGDTWYIPGGNSYMGNFMKDAGADYLWSELKNSGSVPLAFETVFSKAINADFWLIKYNNTQRNLSYKQLAEEYMLYCNFNAYKKRNIFAVNSGTTLFYEEGPLEPDVVLKDMISIFHPELFPNNSNKYYQALSEE